MSLSINQFYKPLPDIGLFAKMRSGKDEVYKVLHDMGYDVARIAFGDQLKESFSNDFPHIPMNPKPTARLIAYGQLKREENPNIWVEHAMLQREAQIALARAYGDQEPSFVYTDIRQPNEYQAVKDTGAIMVKVTAPLETRLTRMYDLGETPDKEVLEAPTELMMDSFEADYVIDNSGSREDLQKQLTEMIYKIQEERLSD